MSNCHLSLSRILLVFFPTVFVTGIVCLVWRVNMALEVSGGILRRGVCAPRDLGKGRLRLSCLIRGGR